LGEKWGEKGGGRRVGGRRGRRKPVGDGIEAGWWGICRDREESI